MSRTLLADGKKVIRAWESDLGYRWLATILFPAEPSDGAKATDVYYGLIIGEGGMRFWDYWSAAQMAREVASGGFHEIRCDDSQDRRIR
ncbi:MAG: hypothetical protein HYS81_04375 [Candidatus Aenigmatarchaeota archaeon]|nr:MAG: hypothetical protein HYS81_04375 [Candidatus Aenigmarchaeota archaeon]